MTTPEQTPESTTQAPSVGIVSSDWLAVLEAAHAAVAELHGALHAADDWGHGHLCTQIERAIECAMPLVKIGLLAIDENRRTEAYVNHCEAAIDMDVDNTSDGTMHAKDVYDRMSAAAERTREAIEAHLSSANAKAQP